jgi:hypothetical protein
MLEGEKVLKASLLFLLADILLFFGVEKYLSKYHSFNYMLVGFIEMVAILIFMLIFL